ncbi:MAG: sugar phosphate isomerase/epimerase [Thermoguttaceae bacterium]|jgi:sugar phosphate isomerase/epimerase
MSITRREALKLASGTAALCAAGLNPLAALAAAGKKIPIALQLYSLRDTIGKDVPGTLAAVAKMGYQGVEFAGYCGKKAEDLRKILDQTGLKCCGTHTGIDTLLGDNLKRTVEFNRTLGNAFLIVPWLGEKYMASIAAIQDTAKLLTELAAKVKPEGMHVGYHSHGGDFRKIEGQTCWDRLFSSTGPDVVMQLDVGNCLGGGGDPLAVLEKFPGRCLTIHIKEFGGKPGATIGEGTVPWKELFRICETTAGTQWYIVEQEAYAVPPLESVKQCIENLRKMGK